MRQRARLHSMWPNQPEDLVRHITKGDIRPLMQHNALMTPGAAWYGDGGNTNLKLGQPQRKGAFSPPRSASKKPNGKMKRPSQQRPPSAPLLSNLGSSKPVLLGSSKPVRPQTASGLPHAASAAQFAAGHALGGPLLQPKRAAKLRMPNSATQAELTRLKRTTSGGALPPRLADDLLEGPVVLGGAGGAEYDRRSGGVRPAEYTGGVRWPHASALAIVKPCCRQALRATRRTKPSCPCQPLPAPAPSPHPRAHRLPPSSSNQPPLHRRATSSGSPTRGLPTAGDHRPASRCATRQANRCCRVRTASSLSRGSDQQPAVAAAAGETAWRAQASAATRCSSR